MTGPRGGNRSDDLQIWAVAPNIENKQSSTAEHAWSSCMGTESAAMKNVQGGSNMTGTDLYVNKPHCAAAVRP